MRRTTSTSALILLCSCLALLGRQVARAQDFATLSDAVEGLNLTALQGAVASSDASANLTSVLADPNTQVILLAPTNEAFFSLLAQTNLTSIPQQLVSIVLLYHIIPIPYPGATLIPNATYTVSTAVQNLPGFGSNSTQAVGNLTFVPLGGNALYIGGVPSGAILNTSTSYTAGKSRIYIIDNVLLPPAKSLQSPPIALSVYKALLASPNTTLAALLVSADPYIMQALQDPDLAVTFFAPTDAAILSLVGGDRSLLADMAGSDAFRRLLLAHVLRSRPYTSRQLPPNTTVAPSASFDRNDTLTIVNSNGTVTVSGAGNPAPATVVIPDIVGGKSVVHVIDQVLLPYNFLNATSPEDDDALPPSPAVDATTTPPPTPDDTATTPPSPDGTDSDTTPPPPADGGDNALATPPSPDGGDGVVDPPAPDYTGEPPSPDYDNAPPPSDGGARRRLAQFANAPPPPDVPPSPTPVDLASPPPPDVPPSPAPVDLSSPPPPDVPPSPAPVDLASPPPPDVPPSPAPAPDTATPVTPPSPAPAPDAAAPPSPDASTPVTPPSPDATTPITPPSPDATTPVTPPSPDGDNTDPPDAPDSTTSPPPSPPIIVPSNAAPPPPRSSAAVVAPARGLSTMLAGVAAALALLSFLLA